MSIERNSRMDYFKGILMLGVVIGHLITSFKAGSDAEVAIHTFVRAYDMPFFMLISGYFLAKSVDRYVPWKNALNKISSILIPLVLWLSVFYVFRVIISAVLSGFSFSVKEYISYLVNSSWFLWSALICSVIMIAICGILKRQELRLVAAIIVSLGFLFVPKDIYNLAFMFPFFAVGFFIDYAVSKLPQRAVEIIKTASVIAFIVLLCFWSMDYTVWSTGSYILNGEMVDTLIAVVFRFAIGATGCVTMSVIFDALLSSNNKLLSFINRQLIAAGRNTLTIYLFQGFVVEFIFTLCIKKLVEMMGRNIFVINTPLLGYVIAPVAAFVCVVVLNLVINKMKRIPYIGKYIFGFKIIKADKSNLVKGSENE